MSKGPAQRPTAVMRVLVRKAALLHVSGRDSESMAPTMPHSLRMARSPCPGAGWYHRVRLVVFTVAGHYCGIWSLAAADKGGVWWKGRTPALLRCWGLDSSAGLNGMWARLPFHFIIRSLQTTDHFWMLCGNIALFARVVLQVKKLHSLGFIPAGQAWVLARLCLLIGGQDGDSVGCTRIDPAGIGLRQALESVPALHNVQLPPLVPYGGQLRALNAENEGMRAGCI